MPQFTGWVEQRQLTEQSVRQYESRLVIDWSQLTNVPTELSPSGILNVDQLRPSTLRILAELNTGTATEGLGIYDAQGVLVGVIPVLPVNVVAPPPPPPPPPDTTPASVTMPASAAVTENDVITLSATVRNAAGEVLANVTVGFTTSDSSILALNAATATTDALGVASVYGSAFIPGSATVTATVGSLTASTVVTVEEIPAEPPPSTVPTPTAGDTVLIDEQATWNSQPDYEAWRTQWFAAGRDTYAPTQAENDRIGLYDDAGVKKLRFEWYQQQYDGSGVPIGDPDQGITVIREVPEIDGTANRPTSQPICISWKQRLGRYAADADGSGTADTFSITNDNASVFNAGMKRMRFTRVNMDASLANFDIIYPGPSPVGPQLQFEYDVEPPSPSAGEETRIISGNTATPFDPEAHIGVEVTTTLYYQPSSGVGVRDGIVRLWFSVGGTDYLHIERTDLYLSASYFDRFEFPIILREPEQDQTEYWWDLTLWLPGAAPGAAVASVTVLPANPSVAVGESQPFSYELRDADDNLLDNAAYGAPAWASGNTAAATIDASTGLAASVAEGASLISCTVEGVTGSTTLTVVAGAPAAVTSVTTTPVDEITIASVGGTGNVQVNTFAGGVEVFGRTVTINEQSAGVSCSAQSFDVNGRAQFVLTRTATGGQYIQFVCEGVSPPMLFIIP